MTYTLSGLTGALDLTKTEKDVFFSLYWRNRSGAGVPAWSEIEAQITLEFDNTASPPTQILTYRFPDYPSATGNSSPAYSLYSYYGAGGGYVAKEQTLNGYVPGQGMNNGKVTLKIWCVGGGNDAEVKTDAPLISSPSFIVLPYSPSNINISGQISPRYAAPNVPGTFKYKISNFGVDRIRAASIIIPGNLINSSFFDVVSVSSLKATTATISTYASASGNGQIDLVYSGAALAVGEEDEVTINVAHTPLDFPQTASWDSIYTYANDSGGPIGEIASGDQGVKMVGPSSSTHSISTRYASPYDHSIGTGTYEQALRFTFNNGTSSPEPISSAQVVIPGGNPGQYYSNIVITGVGSNVTVTSLVAPNEVQPLGR